MYYWYYTIYVNTKWYHICQTHVAFVFIILYAIKEVARYFLFGKFNLVPMYMWKKVVRKKMHASGIENFWLQWGKKSAKNTALKINSQIYEEDISGNFCSWNKQTHGTRVWILQVRPQKGYFFILNFPFKFSFFLVSLGRGWIFLNIKKIIHIFYFLLIESQTLNSKNCMLYAQQELMFQYPLKRAFEWWIARYCILPSRWTVPLKLNINKTEIGIRIRDQFLEWRFMQHW